MTIIITVESKHLFSGAIRIATAIKITLSSSNITKAIAFKKTASVSSDTILSARTRLRISSAEAAKKRRETERERERDREREYDR